jgi:hypothetical protein
MNKGKTGVESIAAGFNILIIFHLVFFPSICLHVIFFHNIFWQVDLKVIILCLFSVITYYFLFICFFHFYFLHFLAFHLFCPP